ncbi:Bin3-type SAM domain-containing protein [Mycena indigotica]|uniref:Bin3-type SAM domain-containing protein n=1 Tax=Mycena indigotica TaxID=2126181 RepID=A0A8H6WF23_9AGAR|nr:Bin3-type SAM domain-containing protein [Mycena indigotica]KAF7310074.1 Bin3-type SAM domain-containing protein [Mycena indigotica]
MPSRRPTRKGTKASPDLGPQDLADNAESWGEMINALCKYFQLPETTTRTGLKRIHSRFDGIYRCLEQEYQKSQDERVKGGIVGIYTRMCGDAILRNKLFERGFVNQVIPLLAIPFTRNLALQCLAIMTAAAGEHVRIQSALSTTAPLLQCLKDFPEDQTTLELSLTIIAHCVTANLTPDGSMQDKKLRKLLPLPVIVEAITDALRHSPSLKSHATVDHGILFVASMTQHVELKPSATNLLVAGLRGADWVFRARCLAGLFRMHIEDSEDDMRTTNLPRIMNCFSGKVNSPRHLRSAMETYGLDRCEALKMINGQSLFNDAMRKAISDKDLYALGKTVVLLILQTESPFQDSYWPWDVGLPFRRWTDSFPHCAKAIRAKGLPSETDLADILDLKYLLIHQQHGAAMRMAEAALKRNPDFAYGYYILTLGEDDYTGLRAAKKGLKCAAGPLNLGPFLRFQMLQRAVGLAGDLALQTLQDPTREIDDTWALGVAFVASALEDGKVFLDEAPPDHKDVKTVACWVVLLTLISEEPISDDLREPFLEKLKQAQQMSTWLGVRPPQTQIRLTTETIVKRFSAAQNEWAAKLGAVEHTDEGEQAASQNPTTERLETELSAWLADSEVEGHGHGHGCGHDHDHGHGTGSPSPVKIAKTTLYRCSYCRNPSAMLRKCGGCSEARYCDAGCQKRDWKEHKKKCAGKI